MKIAMVAYNSWFAPAIISGLKDLRIDSLIILTNEKIFCAIDYLLKIVAKEVEITYIFELNKFIEEVNQKSNIYFICDQPLRNIEMKCFYKINSKVTVIEMTHGISNVSGVMKIKKMFTNFIRRIIFKFVTINHEVHRILKNNASGVLYLDLIQTILNLKPRIEESEKIILFATSGAGRYKDRDFKNDTKNAFLEAKSLSKKWGCNIVIMSKNNEDIDYLNLVDTDTEVVTGGLPYITTLYQGEITVICFKQSTMLYEIRALGLDGYYYNARFKELKVNYHSRKQHDNSLGKLIPVQQSEFHLSPTNKANEIKDQLYRIVTG